MSANSTSQSGVVRRTREHRRRVQVHDRVLQGGHADARHRVESTR